MSRTATIYLASGSPRRHGLLMQLGYRHRILVPDVDEAPLWGESPADYVRRLARIKAEAAAVHVAQRRLKVLPVLAADTAVILGRRILGKPQDAEHATAMLSSLSGRAHHVLTAVALAFRGKLAVALSDTTVWLRRLSREEIAAYVATGEPMDKAGAYAIQGRAAAFIRRIDGSYSGVMGLPLFETAQLLKKWGITPA